VRLPADFVKRLSSSYAERSVCVTGGAGFIGGHLVDALVSLGADVSVIDDLSNSSTDHLADLMELEPTRVRLFHASILDDDAVESALRGCDLCFHLAAVGSVPLSISDPRRSWSVNATGTVRVLEACRRLGTQRIVSASSSSVYGDGSTPGNNSSPPVPKQESAALQPLSPYAASKVSGEAAVRAWSAAYGLSGVSLRFFNVFGPRQNPASAYAAVVPAFARQLLSGKPPVIFGDGGQSRDFTPVACAVAACLLAGATRSTLNGQAVNIGTGISTPVKDLAVMMAELVGAPQLLPVFQPPRSGDVRHSLAETALAKSLFDYSPIVTLRPALQETVAFYRHTLASA
jgi:nucleoside-diphosphate-sugar epimerase